MIQSHGYLLWLLRFSVWHDFLTLSLWSFSTISASQNLRNSGNCYVRYMYMKSLFKHLYIPIPIVSAFCNIYTDFYWNKQKKGKSYKPVSCLFQCNTGFNFLFSFFYLVYKITESVSKLQSCFNTINRCPTHKKTV
jgi:hypothetical protein